MVQDLQKLFDEYIYELRSTGRRRPETLRSYGEVFSTFIKVMPEVSLDILTHKLMVDFFSRLQVRERIVGKGTKKVGVKDSTIETYRSKLNTFFEWLVKRGHITENPLINMKRVKLGYYDVKSLRQEEIDKIRAAIEGHTRNLLQIKRDNAILYTLIFCGLRKGELISLKVTDVDFERRILTIRGETSKSKRTRRIPLNSQLMMRLEDYLQQRNKHNRYKTPNLFISLNEDKGLSSHGLKHWVERLKELSGVKFHLHQFRHTFAHNLAANEVNTIQLQKLLGHTDLRMTQAYVRSLSAEDMRPAIDTLSVDDLV